MSKLVFALLLTHTLQERDRWAESHNITLKGRTVVDKISSLQAYCCEGKIGSLQCTVHVGWKDVSVWGAECFYICIHLIVYILYTASLFIYICFYTLECAVIPFALKNDCPNSWGRPVMN